MQVPFLARNYRVITFDPRGNGRSDRPRDPAAYADAAFASDVGAVLDATGTERAVLAAFCSGFPWALLFAAAHPQRVTGIVAIAPTLPIPPADPWERAGYSFDDVLDTTEGWAKENRHYWRRDWRGYVEFFMSQIATEPHSTKPYDDLVEWGMQTDAETMLCDADAPQQIADEKEAVRLCRSLACPVLVIGGDQDKIVPPERARRIAELTGAELLVIEGGGHAPHVRYPVAVNHAIRDFVDGMVPRPRKQAAWRATHGRPRRALWISSPIGLGHVQRDLAIARALRQRVPDLEIHWWAQPPVTEVLAGAGEIIHPASSDLVSESAHWESESAHHDLPAFYAFRRMDEILCANYLLFDDVVRDTSYDLWVGDECWEIDYFLHENPERKIAPYVFMTDVIGFLPTDPGDPREAELCADYNADSIEKRERFPRLRDLSMFIGSFDELPDLSFGPGLPGNTVMVQPVVHLGPLRAPVQPRCLPRPRRPAPPARLPPAPAAACRRGGRHRGRPQPAGTDLRRLRAATQAGAGRADASGHRPSHRSPAAAGHRGHGQARICPRSLRAFGVRRRGRRAGRAVHDDGTGRHRAAVHLLPAAPPLGTAALRRAPAQSLPGRAADGLCDDHSRRPGHHDAHGPGAERHRAGLPEGPAKVARTARPHASLHCWLASDRRDPSGGSAARFRLLSPRRRHRQAGEELASRGAPAHKSSRHAWRR